MLKSGRMTERAYYTDSYTSTFSASVVAQFEADGHPCLILDHTFFYPVSGGQPADRGTIAGIPVTDVFIRPEDSAIIHVVERLPETSEVKAVLDWARRFDHMQQHTGQHILSQAFIRIAAAETVGFHLSEETLTIDLGTQELQQSVIDAAESEANRIVWQNRPVIVRWASREEASAMNLRKIPANGGEKLRLIDILDYDLTACGGTHVSRTGEVGLIKIIKQESRNQKVRIHFVCGGRALEHYHYVNQVVAELTTQLTTGAVELSAAVAKLQDNEKQARRLSKQLQEELDSIEAARLLQESPAVNGVRIVTYVMQDDTSGRARAMAARLAGSDGVIALIGASGPRSLLAFGRSDNAPGDMRELLQVALGHLESGAGGGSTNFAQGGAQATERRAIQEAIELAAQQLLEDLGAAN